MNQEHNIEALPLKDERIICCDCGATFIFTVGEQRYFLSKSLSVPKRCASCRQRRRETLVREKGQG